CNPRFVDSLSSARERPMHPPHSTDENLLFALLARQLGIVEQDQLRAALGDWARAPDKPPGHILKEQGALQPDDAAQLERLVAEHLQEQQAARPAVTTRCTLDQVGLSGEECLPAPETRASLGERVLGAVAPNVTRDTVESGTPSWPEAADKGEASNPQPIAPAGCRYRVLRPHARGGLGEVFLAR